MSDKRSTHTDALETLGTIIQDGERDAIHLAVEPVIAGEKLNPGDHIGLRDERAYIMEKSLGIVDPFLNKTIQPGEKFWLVVYPRQITSLRHVWSHPSFPEPLSLSERKTMEDAARIANSQRWLEWFAGSIGTDYYTLIEGAKDYNENGDYLHMGNNEEYSSHYDKMDDFWKHFEIVTDIIPGRQGGFFSCSC